MATLETFDDTICQTLNNLWHETGYKMEWPNVKREDGKPPLFEGEDPWGRLTIQLLDSEQTTLAEPGARRFVRSGLATVQCFVPAGERGLERARALSMVALNAFEGRTVDGVRFVRVSPKDVGPDGHWYQFNVVASFEFDEVK
jgi:hypothetical protein